MSTYNEKEGFNHYNFFDELEWINGKYYKEGSLVTYADAICTKPVKLFPGAMVCLSSFDTSISKSGARVSFWKNKQWIKDISGSDTKDVDYVTIPKDCNEVSLTLRKSDQEKYVYISGNQDVDDSKAILALIRQNYRINERFEGKTVSILGDSVSTFGGNYTTDTDGNKWSDGVYTYPGNRVRYPVGDLTDVNDTWWMRLINKNHMKLLVNDSWAGSRVSWNGVTENATEGEKIHMASATRIQHLGEKGIPDIIFVFGGSNDIMNNVLIYENNEENLETILEKELTDLTVSAFSVAYRNMLIRIQQSYPNTKIYCILPYLITARATMARINTYNKVMKEICDCFGIETIDARKCGMTTFGESNYLLDNVHLNVKGMELLFQEIDNI